MPSRRDIKSILIIGSGPIVVGQACEFDYSGNQAVRALKEEGYRVIVHNPNPATVMTISGVADQVSFDPLLCEYARDVIRRTRPDAVLTTMGGQSALNLSLELEQRGVLKEYGVELIGARAEQITMAEDRGVFKALMERIGLACPFSQQVATVEEGLALATRIGYPVIVRPSFTLGGRGGGIARSEKSLRTLLSHALATSPSHSALVEESLLSYQEFEFELMRDKDSNALVVCSIENIDPMGIHTGDSITVAPIQTLSDDAYQTMRSAALSVMEAIGIDCGGANVQFAYHPATKRQLVIEMNPRVSRSSALASKATGFPIARCSAKLAVGCTLDEILNEITGKTRMFFEPSLDYCAVKVPRFEMDKFPIAYLGTQMHSVGETLAIGRSFIEALNKAILSSESGFIGFEPLKNHSLKELDSIIKQLHPLRSHAIVSYFYMLFKEYFAGHTVPAHKNSGTETDLDANAPLHDHKATNNETTNNETTNHKTTSDRGSVFDTFFSSVPYPEIFLSHISRIVKKTAISTWVIHHLCEYALLLCAVEELSQEDLQSLVDGAYSTQDQGQKPDQNHAQTQTQAKAQARTQAILTQILIRAKESGMCDSLIAKRSGIDEELIVRARRVCGIVSGLASIDTCAAEFEAETPYLYSSYRAHHELAPLKSKKEDRYPIVILGSGPNRIGQGLEFDTCCTMAIRAFKRRNHKVIIINNNPETVSTDYNVSDRLYLEPLFPEYVERILRYEQGDDWASNPKQQKYAKHAKPVAPMSSGIEIVAQLGGQTSLNLARTLTDRGLTLLGTSFASINAAEDREQFSQCIHSLGLTQPKHRIANTLQELKVHAKKLGFPVLIRPSFVIGGQAMEVVYSEREIDLFIARHRHILSDDPILIDEFLEQAEEYDIDAVADSDSVFIGGVLRHIEHAGVHSGDSASVYTPFVLTQALMQDLYCSVYAICQALDIRGCVNIQCAIKNDTIYILEVNPRASRTMPLVSKTSKVDLIDLAAGVWLGETLAAQPCFARYKLKNHPHIAVAHSEVGWVVKESVFSFDRFGDIDPRLSPQMQSTGEVIGLGTQYGEAFAKASAAAHCLLPTVGLVYVSINPRERDSRSYYLLAQLNRLGFSYCAHQAMCKALKAQGIACEPVEADVYKRIEQGDIALMINVPEHRKVSSRDEGRVLRNLAVRHRIPYITTIPGLKGAVEGIAYLQTHQERCTVIDFDDEAYTNSH